MENSLTIALIILLIHYTSWDGEIFAGIKKIVKPENILSKPLYGCPICMTPWWGTVIYWIFFHHSIKDWILVVGGAAGLAVLFVVGLSIRDACLKYLDV